MNNDDSQEQMATNAKEFMELSKKILAEAMASCQIEGFQSTTLNIPANINEHSAPPRMLSQEQIWQQVNQLYTAQGNLFSPTDILVTPVAPEPHNESQLDEINRMLDM
jgi:hypothetical protein